MQHDQMDSNIVQSFLSHNSMANLQLESYNSFVHAGLPVLFTEQEFELAVQRQRTMRICFQNVYVSGPYTRTDEHHKQPLFPDEARLRDMDYDAKVFVDLSSEMICNQTQTVISSTVFSQVELLRLPVMVRSSLCSLGPRDVRGECTSDPGGYFILKGKERVLVAQERINYNQVYVFRNRVHSNGFTAEIRSVKEDADYSVLVQMNVYDRQLTVQLPYISGEIPLMVVLLAFDVPSHELREHNWDEEDEELIEEHIARFASWTAEKAVEYIAARTIHRVDDMRANQYAKNLLYNEIMPHFGFRQSATSRARFLFLVLRKLLRTASGMRPVDDRDHIANKRVELTGDLMFNLLRGLLKRCMKSVGQYVYKREDTNVVHAIQRFNLTHRMVHCFSTGNWGMPKSNYVRQGVSQILSRLSYLATVSHLRRLVVPIGKESRNTQVRQLHSSSFGFMCCVETPEGASSGIVKNFALFTRVSTGTDTVVVVDSVRDAFVIEPLFAYAFTVYVNGVAIGSVPSESLFPMVRVFREKRREQWFPRDASISWCRVDQEVHICSDTGRILRAVHRVFPGWMEQLRRLIEQLPVELLWGELVRLGAVVFIDGMEAECSLIAMRPEDISAETDFCEIHPSAMLGISASLTPYPEHSQGPRNVYQACMGKQALGVYTLSHRHRFDTVAHTLQNPQRRIVSTEVGEFSGTEGMASGSNCVIAILSYTGFNQEDSIIVNQSAIDRGLFRSVTVKSVTTSEKKCGTYDTEQICVPPVALRQHMYNYDKLGPDGIVAEGDRVEERDILVGRVFYQNETPYKDCSLSCKKAEAGVVDSVCLTITPSGHKMVKIRIRSIRIPEIGDKFCHVSAQKGTIGMTYRQEDMPFTADGIVPDVILNPHAIPSRMTINMLLEMMQGKACSLDGTGADAGAFRHSGEEVMSNASAVLREHGFSPMGYEHMTNGFTGEPIRAKVFLGVGYYQRLKHMVADKIHVRNRGNVQLLSRQPCAGRSRDGGLRFGEMEKDCMIAHGVSSFLKERLFDMSDAYSLLVCADCGTTVNETERCYQCGENSAQEVYLPYACKLLFQELQAMCIRVKMKTK